MANNIELLNSYVDKDNKHITVLSFSGGKYLCAYSDGSRAYLSKDEIFDKKVEVKIVEPEYFEEQIFSFPDRKLSPSEDVLFDDSELEEEPEYFVQEEVPERVKEEEDSSEDDDFYKDFL